MVGIITEPITTNRALDRQGTNVVPSSTSEVLNATLEDAFTRNPTPSLFREIRRTRQDVAGILGEMEEDEAAPRLMEPDEANQRFGIEGKLTFDAATTEGVAEELNRLKREELQREDVFRRAQGGAGQWSARFGVGLAASALDPLNIASAFIPIVGPSRYALWLEGAGSALGRAGIRARVGAVEGLAGAALLEPIVYGVAKSEQADYTAADSILNLAFGTVLGGGLHAGFGAVADSVRGPLARQIDAMEPAEREASLRTAVAQVAEGRPVDVEAFFLRQELLSSTVLARQALIPDRFDAGDILTVSIERTDIGVFTRTEHGQLFAKADPDALTIKFSEVAEDFRGQREGVALYERLIAEAQERGLLVRSDMTVENDAVRVYEALGRRGYDVQRNPTAFEIKEKDGTVVGVAAKAGGPSEFAKAPFIIRPPQPAKALEARAGLDRAVSRVVRQDVAGFVDPTDLKTAQSIPPAPKGVTPEIARQESVKDVDNMLQTVNEAINQAKAAGRLTEGDLKALGEADELVKRADVMGRAAKAGAACMAQ